jgi:hypothetical protein
MKKYPQRDIKELLSSVSLCMMVITIFEYFCWPQDLYDAIDVGSSYIGYNNFQQSTLGTHLQKKSRKKPVIMSEEVARTIEDRKILIASEVINANLTIITLGTEVLLSNSTMDVFAWNCMLKAATANIKKMQTLNPDHSFSFDKLNKLRDINVRKLSWKEKKDACLVLIRAAR